MKSLLLLIFIGLNSILVSAQDRLIEIKLNGNVSSSTSVFESFDNSIYAGVGYDIEGHYYLSPKIGIGVFYAQSVNRYDLNEASIAVGESDMYGLFSFRAYGLSGKVTTSRARFFQVYARARFFFVQNVYDFEEDYGFSVGDKGLAAGVGGGIVFKISRTIAFNFFELNYNKYLTGMGFSKENFSPGEVQLKSGFLINLLPRK